MQGTIKLERKLRAWKEKAKKRSKIISALGKRNGELTRSRDLWKEKYNAERQLRLGAEAALRKAGREKDIDVDGARASRHSYPLLVMQLCLLLRQFGSSSLRGCRNSIRVFSLVTGIDLRRPSKSTIQNWERKMGLYHYEKQPKPSGKWAVLLDESISIGQEKLLLILGLPLSGYGFGSAPALSDMELLYLGAGPSWTGERISDKLKALEAKGLDIDYAVSDGGTNLVKALKMSNIERIEDCTHAFGNILKRQYNDCERFRSFCKQAGIFKRQVQLGENACLAPPQQRVKGRFLNLIELGTWAKKTLRLLAEGRLDAEAEAKIEWLKDYADLVEDIHVQCVTMNSLFKVLKNKGLNGETKMECESILEKSACNETFKSQAREYLEENVRIKGGKETVLCCSDIIESTFGSYKNQSAKGQTKRITDACLTIGNYGKKMDLASIKNGMELVKIVDLKNWKKENMPTSHAQRKKEMYKNTG